MLKTLILVPVKYLFKCAIISFLFLNEACNFSFIFRSNIHGTISYGMLI